MAQRGGKCSLVQRIADRGIDKYISCSHARDRSRLSTCRSADRGNRGVGHDSRDPEINQLKRRVHDLELQQEIECLQQRIQKLQTQQVLETERANPIRGEDCGEEEDSEGCEFVESSPQYDEYEDGDIKEEELLWVSKNLNIGVKNNRESLNRELTEYTRTSATFLDKFLKVDTTNDDGSTMDNDGWPTAAVERNGHQPGMVIRISNPQFMGVLDIVRESWDNLVSFKFQSTEISSIDILTQIVEVYGENPKTIGGISSHCPLVHNDIFTSKLDSRCVFPGGMRPRNSVKCEGIIGGDKIKICVASFTSSFRVNNTRKVKIMIPCKRQPDFPFDPGGFGSTVKLVDEFFRRRGE